MGGKFCSVWEINISPNHGSNIVATQCVIEVKADAIVVVERQVIPLLLLFHLLLIVNHVMLTFHMIRCVHSRWVKASVQCFYVFSHRSHARLLIRQRSPLVYFARYEHNQRSTYIQRFIKRYIMLYSLNDFQNICHLILKWPILFLNSAGSISFVRLQAAAAGHPVQLFLFSCITAPHPP